MFLFKFQPFLILLLIVFGFVGSNYAVASYFAKDDDESIVQLGIEGTYLWQTDNTVEVDSSTQTQFQNSFAIPVVNETLEPNWGGGMNLGYIFPYHEYDVQVSYNFLRLNDTEHGDIPVIVNDDMPLPVASNSKLEFSYDDADILLGTYFSPTERWLLRLGYGLGFVRIAEKSYSVFDDRGSDLGFPHLTHVNDVYSRVQFMGLGPKVALDGMFRLMPQIYVVGQLGVSVLYGKSESRLSVTGLIINDAPQTPQHSFSEDTYQAALGFEGKVGLAYAASYSEDIGWDIEAGFKGQSYVNALQDESYDVVLGPDADITTFDFDGTYSNFGPYVNLTLNFM